MTNFDYSAPAQLFAAHGGAVAASWCFGRNEGQGSAPEDREPLPNQSAKLLRADCCRQVPSVSFRPSVHRRLQPVQALLDHIDALLKTDQLGF
jgi:hypothetical protein